MMIYGSGGIGWLLVVERWNRRVVKLVLIASIIVWIINIGM
jgi:hypothetical protein